MRPGDVAAFIQATPGALWAAEEEQRRAGCAPEAASEQPAVVCAAEVAEGPGGPVPVAEPSRVPGGAIEACEGEVRSLHPQDWTGPRAVEHPHEAGGGFR